MNQETKMNPEVKKLWVDALRSGEYQQGRDYLMMTTPDGIEYCCLGVLTELYNKLFPGNLSYEKLENGAIQVRDEMNKYGLFTQKTNSYLIEPVLNWAGLNSCNPTVNTQGGTGISLAGLNDDKKLTFDEIADCIDNSL